MKGVTIILIAIIGIMTSVNYYIKNKDVIKIKSSIDINNHAILLYAIFKIVLSEVFVGFGDFVFIVECVNQ